MRLHIFRKFEVEGIPQVKQRSRAKVRGILHHTNRERESHGCCWPTCNPILTLISARGTTGWMNTASSPFTLISPLPTPSVSCT